MTEGIDNKKPLSDHLAEDTDKGSHGKVPLDDRLGRHTKAKLRLGEMVSYLDSISHTDHLAKDLHSRIKDCCSYLLFHNYFRIDQTKLVTANFCKKHLVCPACAMRRGGKALRTLSERFDSILQGNPELVPWLVTITVKNGADLRERFTHLNNGITTLIRRRRNDIARGTSLSQLSQVTGGFGSFELTYSESTYWHPHYHSVMLLPAGEKIDPVALSKEWHEITGDSFIVDARRLTLGEDNTFIKSFLEVTKYALKFSDMTPELNFEAFKSLRGKRLFRSFGDFFGLKIPDDYSDHNAYLDDEPYIELIYSWMHHNNYSLTKVITEEDRYEEEKQEAN